jgi:hypothetical protein
MMGMETDADFDPRDAAVKTTSNVRVSCGASVEPVQLSFCSKYSELLLPIIESVPIVML